MDVPPRIPSKEEGAVKLGTSVYGLLTVKNPSVNASVEMLRNFDQKKLQDYMRRDREKLFELGRHITPVARRNWELEREITKLDHQIKLLVKHQITAAEVIRDSSVLGEELGEKAGTLTDKKELYEQLFFLLSTRPDYIAQLAHKATKRQQDDFVKTVVFDIFGDFTDSRSETTLLQIFRRAMEIEFETNPDLGSLFRDNKSVMALLKTYSQRGPGQTVIRDILAKPIKDVFGQKNLVLEIDVNKVYSQVIKTYEEKTRRPWPRERQVSTRQAYESPFVQQLCKPRTNQLKFICNHFLERIIQNVEKIPWGVRWICKQFAQLGAEKFPDADRFQIGSLVGGFIYLRLFNPAIVTPETMSLVSGRPSKNTRRNLILIAKVLQNLSNGKDFNNSELFMVPMNEFLHDKRNAIQNYFAKLIDVEDLDFRAELDRLEKQRDRQHIVTTTINQVFLIHRLLVEHKSLFRDPNDPILRVLVMLGEVPEAVKIQENHKVTLRLTQNFEDQEDLQKLNIEQAASTTMSTFSYSHFFGDRVKSEVKNATDALQDFSQKLDLSKYSQLIQQHRRDFEGFIQKVIGLENKDSGLAQHVNAEICTAVDSFALSGMTYTQFISSYVDNIRSLHKRAKQLHEHVQNVQRASHTVDLQQKKLSEKLKVFKDYLDVVQKGGHAQEVSAQEKKKKTSTKPQKTEVVFTHKELVNQGVILSIAKKHENDAKRLKYKFHRVARGEYEIIPCAQIMLKSFPVLDPISITMLQLLDLEAKYKNQFTVLDKITLNVNLLKTLLVKTFKE